MLLACPTWRLAQKCPENNSQVPIPRAQRVADRVHLQLAFLLVWDSNPQDAKREIWTPYQLSHPGRLYSLENIIFFGPHGDPHHIFQGTRYLNICSPTLLLNASNAAGQLSSPFQKCTSMYTVHNRGCSINVIDKVYRSRCHSPILLFANILNVTFILI